MTINECAYKSNHADVLAYWERIASDEWANQIRAYGEEHGVGREFLSTGRTRFSGFVAPDDPATLPKGWRVAKVTRQGCTTTFVTPDLRTKIGKAHEQWFKDHGERPYVHRMPGMRGEVFSVEDGGMRIVTASQAFLHDGTVYLKWTLPREKVEGEGDRLPGKVDHTMWEAIPMSEYHLARETEFAANEPATA